MTKPIMAHMHAPVYCSVYSYKCNLIHHHYVQSVVNRSAVMVLHRSQSEPLTLFIGSSASSTIPVFVHLKGWRPLYNNPFKVDDTLYLVLHASRGEVPWCGHRCALPIPRSHKWELCSCRRPVFLSATIMTRMHGWQVYKGTNPQRTTLTSRNLFTILVLLDRNLDPSCAVLI